jgi:hypothetical protein
MKVLGMAGTYYNSSEMEAVGLPNPCYIQQYDLDYAEGRGRAMLTGDVTEAATWGTEIEVIKAWQSISPTLPKRDDGRPNRPLTAYTISPEAVE